MLDTEPESIGHSSWSGVRAGPYGPGVLISKVGTVCASCASTGLCGGQRATAVPTATPWHWLAVRVREIGTDLTPLVSFS